MPNFCYYGRNYPNKFVKEKMIPEWIDTGRMTLEARPLCRPDPRLSNDLMIQREVQKSGAPIEFYQTPSCAKDVEMCEFGDNMTCPLDIAIPSIRVNRALEMSLEKLWENMSKQEGWTSTISKKFRNIEMAKAMYEATALMSYNVNPKNERYKDIGDEGKIR